MMIQICIQRFKRDTDRAHGAFCFCMKTVLLLRYWFFFSLANAKIDRCVNQTEKNKRGMRKTKKKYLAKQVNRRALYVLFVSIYAIHSAHDHYHTATMHDSFDMYAHKPKKRCKNRLIRFLDYFMSLPNIYERTMHKHKKNVKTPFSNSAWYFILLFSKHMKSSDNNNNLDTDTNYHD